MKVFIVGGGLAYAAMFSSLGHTISKLEDAELVCFTGGADVSPHLYGDSKHPFTGNDLIRDKKEAIIFDYLLDRDIPMVGICRGGQFLNVMSGGRMYQHVDSHCGDHLIRDATSGLELVVSSTHHQMMMPSPKGRIVATAALGGYRQWFDGDVSKEDVSDLDIEVVYYEHTKCLCFQPHPEFDGYPEMRSYFEQCLATYLEVNCELV